MAFNPQNNPLLPPNTALVSTGVTFSLQSTGFAQRGIAKDANGNILFEGPETAASIYTIFDVLYTELYPFSSNQPFVEINILPPIIEDTPTEDEPPEEIQVTSSVEPTPKENAEVRKKDLDEQTKIVQNNTEQPKGLARFTPILLEKGTHIAMTMAPALLELVKEMYQDTVSENACPPQQVTEDVLAKLNNIIDDLNQISEFITKITNFTAGTGLFIDITQQVSTALKYSIPAVSTAAKASPLIPGIVVSALDDLDWFNNNLLYSNDGTPKLPKLKAGVNGITAASSIVAFSINKVVVTIETLSKKLEQCLPEGKKSELKTLSSETKDIAELGNSDFENNNPLTYNGFIIKVETVPFTPTVNRYQAVGYNTYGIPMIKGELSFTPNALVLINELKFIIDRDNLKAY